jgi:hypothetical protein
MFDSCQELSEIIRFSQCQPFLRLLLDYFMNRAIFQPYEGARRLGLDCLSLLEESNERNVFEVVDFDWSNNYCLLFV